MGSVASSNICSESTTSVLFTKEIVSYPWQVPEEDSQQRKDLSSHLSSPKRDDPPEQGGHSELRQTTCVNTFNHVKMIVSA